jgi:hypothetical protein
LPDSSFCISHGLRIQSRLFPPTQIGLHSLYVCIYPKEKAWNPDSFFIDLLHVRRETAQNVAKAEPNSKRYTQQKPVGNFPIKQQEMEKWSPN